MRSSLRLRLRPVVVHHALHRPTQEVQQRLQPMQHRPRASAGCRARMGRQAEHPIVARRPPAEVAAEEAPEEVSQAKATKLPSFASYCARSRHHHAASRSISHFASHTSHSALAQSHHIYHK